MHNTTEYLKVESYAALFVCENVPESSKIIQVSGNVKDYLGYVGQDLIGKPFFNLIPESLHDDFILILRKKFLQPLGPVSTIGLRLPRVLQTQLISASGDVRHVDCAVHEINVRREDGTEYIVLMIEIDFMLGNLIGMADSKNLVRVKFRDQEMPFLHLSSKLLQDPCHANNSMLRFHEVMQSCTSVQECLQWYCSYLLTVSGYEHITLYQFGESKSFRFLLEQASNPNDVQFNPDRYKVAAFDVSNEEWESYVTDTLYVRCIHDRLDTGSRTLGPITLPASAQRYQLARCASPLYVNWMDRMGPRALAANDVRCFGKQAFGAVLHAFQPLRPTFACKKLLHVISGIVSTAVEKFILLDQMKMQNTMGMFLNSPHNGHRNNCSNTVHSRVNSNNSSLEDISNNNVVTIEQGTSLEAVKVLVSAAKAFMSVLEADAVIVSYKQISRQCGNLQGIDSQQIASLLSHVKATQGMSASGWRSTLQLVGLPDASKSFSAFIYIALDTSGDASLFFLKRQLHHRATVIIQEEGKYAEFDGDPFANWKEGAGTLSKLLQVVLRWVVQVAHEVDIKSRHENMRKVLLSSVTQEVGRPVTSVIETIEMIKESRLKGASATEVLTQAVLVMKASSELLNDLLFLSRMRAGRFTLTHEAQNLSQFLSRFIHTLISSGRHSQFHLSLDLKDENLSVMMDARRLRQVLSNMIQVFMSFMDSKQDLDLKITTKAVNDPMVIVRFCLTAEGIKIPSEEMETMFREFDASLDAGKINDLIGLSLPIANRLLKHMGGTITHVLNANNFSEIQIEIPFERVQISSEKPPIIHCGDKNLHVLVVDDNVVNQRLLAKRLEKDGYVVTTASNGREAHTNYLQKLSLNEKYDVVLMDVHMPICSGVEATRLIRESERKTQVDKPAIIIALTGSVSSDQSCRTVGMNGILTKPVDYNLIRQIMKTVEQGIFKDVWDSL